VEPVADAPLDDLPAFMFLLFGLHCFPSFERGIGNFQTNQEGTGTTVAKSGVEVSNMEEFETLLQQLAALNHERRLLHARDENGLPSHPLNVAYRAALEADWRAENPRKKKFDLTRAIDRGEIPNLETIKAEMSAAAERWAKETIHDPKELTENRLFELAVGLPVPAADEWQQIGDVWESTYRSQSYAASKYANAKAHLIADKAVFYGVEASVERYGEGASVGYRVKARTTPTGAEILRRKPDVPVEEWVAACNRRGVNPRVYNPFLPYEVDA
jgi:hypothetical protein